MGAVHSRPAVQRTLHQPVDGQARRSLFFRRLDWPSRADLPCLPSAWELSPQTALPGSGVTNHQTALVETAANQTSGISRRANRLRRSALVLAGSDVRFHAGGLLQNRLKHWTLLSARTRALRLEKERAALSRDAATFFSGNGLPHMHVVFDFDHPWRMSDGFQQSMLFRSMFHCSPHFGSPCSDIQ